jgi:hypothetical protein
MSAEQAVEQIVKKLNAVAVKNNDSFSYSLEIETRRGIEFYFKAIERADSHTFVSGRGATVEAAVANAESGLAEACEEWGYKLPK